MQNITPRVNASGTPITVVKEYRQQIGTITEKGETRPHFQNATKYTVPNSKSRKNINGIMNKPLDRFEKPEGTWTSERFVPAKSGGQGITETSEIPTFAKTRITKIEAPLSSSNKVVNDVKIFNLTNRASTEFASYVDNKIVHHWSVPATERKLPTNPAEKTLQKLLSKLESTRLAKEVEGTMSKPSILENLAEKALKSLRTVK